LADAAVTIRRPTAGRRAGVAALNSRAAFGLGLATLWMSLLVLIPLGAVVWRSQRRGPGTFWRAVTTPEAAAAIRLSVGSALLVALTNAVFGTLIAWVLGRDRFPGMRIVDAVIDLPFALPTIVAGLVLLALYGAHSPIGLELAYTRAGVVVALLFVTLPFVVRAVQPVVLELDAEMEEAAASLGAGPVTIFVRVALPRLLPAISAGTTLAFARAISEFGSTVLISGNLPFKTQVAAVHILGQIEADNTVGAAAVATVLLVVALVVMSALELLQRRAAGGA
jgi:sulfate transport system permease protein